jgi:hypothetical protein
MPKNVIRPRLYYALLGFPLLVAACVAREPSDVAYQCDAVSDGWSRLAQPPSEVAKLLTDPASDRAVTPNRRLHPVAWFQSEDGRVIRYCQYATSQSECNGTLGYQDFERVNDVWTREGGGLEEICLEGRKRR